MGRKTAKLDVTAKLSNHFDEDDEADREKWNKLVAEVKEIVNRPEYEDIVIDFNTWYE
ncbi:hypothetical protein [Micromonospora sp. NPDC049891]|uniref:hypothetical protein n=1 Tax=Micromonospora sp. NPDC049891 TaxID=3155655 RepID=UPI0033D0194C